MLQSRLAVRCISWSDNREPRLLSLCSDVQNSFEPVSVNLWIAHISSHTIVIQRLCMQLKTRDCLGISHDVTIEEDATVTSGFIDSG